MYYKTMSFLYSRCLKHSHVCQNPQSNRFKRARNFHNPSAQIICAIVARFGDDKAYSQRLRFDIAESRQMQQGSDWRARRRRGGAGRGAGAASTLALNESPLPAARAALVISCALLKKFLSRTSRRLPHAIVVHLIITKNDCSGC